MSDQPTNFEPSLTDEQTKLQRRRMFKQRLGLVLVLSLILTAFVVIYLVPPNDQSYYPRCTFHQLTGYHCPGCGGTRCVAALLHGDILQAAAYNLYFLLALPFLLWWGAYGVWATFKGKRFGPPPNLPWLYVFLWLSLTAFAILRNVPVAPFTFLAPHDL